LASWTISLLLLGFLLDFTAAANDSSAVYSCCMTRNRQCVRGPGLGELGAVTNRFQQPLGLLGVDRHAVLGGFLLAGKPAHLVAKIEPVIIGRQVPS